MVILKYPIKIMIRQVVMIPAGAKLLDVQVLPPDGRPPLFDLTVTRFHGVPHLFVLCDQNNSLVPRHIAVYGTGQTIPEEPGEYVATFQMNGGALEFHVLETCE